MRDLSRSEAQAVLDRFYPKRFTCVLSKLGAGGGVSRAVYELGPPRRLVAATPQSWAVALDIAGRRDGLELLMRWTCARLERKDPQPISRQRKWQLERVARGQCSTCGKPRGADGTASMCRSCANANNALSARGRRG